MVPARPINVRRSASRWRFALASALLLAACAAVGADDEPAAEATPPATPQPPEIAKDEFPLEWVVDRTELHGTADSSTYYGILNRVRSVDPAALREAAARFREQRWKDSRFADWPAEEFPLFFDVTDNPTLWRGKPITLFGHVRLHHVVHDENEFGLDPIHEAYLYTEDSQGHPATIVFTENPSNLPVGEVTTSGVEVTGYFLKLYNYPSRDGKTRYSPLILAREVRQVQIVGSAWSTQTQLIVLTILAAAALMIWGVARRMRAADRIARARERKLLGQDAPPDFARIDTTTREP
jgi:hypothetical protein